MREGSTLYYLLGDHLGSTALTLTSSGALEGEVRYGAWGADRYTSGTTTHTTYRYTGQRNESSLGLYFYGARWYDASLGRFIQADTVIPGAGNVQAWDRYAAMFNNPLKYVDPSGHEPCLDDGYCGDPNTDSYQRRILLGDMHDRYDWSVEGDWSLDQLQNIYQTGRDIEAYANNLTDGNGIGWMQEYMGGVTFKKAPNLLDIGGVVPFGPKVIYLSDSVVSYDYIAHELAHVWDINAGTGMGPSTWFGGGPADQLALFVGGDPSGVRWANGTSNIPDQYQWDPYAVSGSYGNTSTADYFAEAFTWSLYPGSVPSAKITWWINAIISLGGSQ